MERGEERNLQKEFEEIRPALKEKLISGGIRAAVFDLDDTILDTSMHYGRHILEFSEAIGSYANITPEEVNEQFMTRITALRPELSVNPALLDVSARNLCLTYGLDPNDAHMQEAIGELLNLYNGKGITVLPGAKETIVFFMGMPVQSILNTHASEIFTDGKLRETGLDRCFPHENR